MGGRNGRGINSSGAIISVSGQSVLDESEAARGYAQTASKELGLRGNIEVIFDENLGNNTAEVEMGKIEHVGGGLYLSKPADKIRIGADLYGSDINEAISHELKHIQQQQTGRLKAGFRLVNGEYTEHGIYWEGKLHTTFADYNKIKERIQKAPRNSAEKLEAIKAYKSLPWEKEAYAFGDRIYK